MTLLLLALLGCAPTPAPTPAPAPPPAAAPAGEPAVVGRGATLFVPVWSSVHPIAAQRTVPLACTLAVRNADPASPIRLVSVRDHGEDGAALQERVAAPRTIAPFAAATFVLPEADLRGGVAASFVVTWEADADVVDPVVDAVCVGTRGGQGLSFASEGRVVARRAAPVSP